MLLSALVNLSAAAQYSTIQVNSHSHSLCSLSCIMQYYFFRGCWHFQISSPSTVHKWGGKLLSSPDRVFFVIPTIIYFSSPPLFLAPRFWEPRDQPQPGFFLEGRERTLGTWLIMYIRCNVAWRTRCLTRFMTLIPERRLSLVSSLYYGYSKIEINIDGHSKRFSGSDLGNLKIINCKCKLLQYFSLCLDPINKNSVLVTFRVSLFALSQLWTSSLEIFV